MSQYPLYARLVACVTATSVAPHGQVRFPPILAQTKGASCTPRDSRSHRQGRANVGLCFKVAKHFASMNPERLIIACRNEAKGNRAVKEIKEATKFDNVELFPVDLASYGSVNAFCEKVEKEVPRLDILVENAALAHSEFIATPDGWEHQLQVNHIAIAQLAILLLPLLLRTASKPGILEWLNDQSKPEGKAMQSCYPVSNLLNLFFARELASRLPEDSSLIVNTVNPGLCISALRRNTPLSSRAVFCFFDIFISWSTERGSRQLIFAALENQDKPDEVKGAYISSSKVVEPSDYVISDEGTKAQKQLWHETLAILSKVSPNIRSILSSNNLL